MCNKDADTAVILLVEDNPAHAELVTRGLENGNIAHTVYHVVDGEEALQYLRRQGNYADPQKSPRPYVILLDLRLPKIDGLTVAREIKSSPDLTSLPIVILTTSKAKEDIHRAYAQHINSYLVKPLDFEKLTQMMRDVGRYWLKWNQVPEE